MPNLGFPEILVILVLVLLVFGAKRLPEIGQSMGKGIREFTRSLKDTQDAVLRDDPPRRSLPDDDRRPSTERPSDKTGEPKRLSE